MIKTYLDFLEVLAAEDLASLHKTLDTVAAGDVAGLRKAEESYGDSWKKRGGVGAFMMLARKWDRIEKQVKEEEAAGSDDDTQQGTAVVMWDILAHIQADPREEGLIDDIRDLRRYLMLVEAEVRARQVGT